MTFPVRAQSRNRYTVVTRSYAAKHAVTYVVEYVVGAPVVVRGGGEQLPFRVGAL